MPDGRSVALVTARSTTQADGIRDYTHLLRHALQRQSVAADILEWSGRGPARPAHLPGVDALVVQYNPFSFGRWGFAPDLPLFLASLRRRRRRPRIAVMFHETYVDMRNARWALMGAWQRAQLLAVQACADVQLCSIQRWTERLRRTALGRPVHHLPVASNLPDARADRERTRAALGAADDTLVLGCVGLRHPGRLEEHVLAASHAAAQAARPVLLLDLGPGERTVERLGAHVTLRRTGFLEERALAGHVAATDVFLAPYRDGVSTRRTTVMAALQHGIPVVGTKGHLTDDVLARAPELVLTGPDRPEPFAAAVAVLAGDDGHRERLGAAGRRLYETRFDWPVLVERLRGHLDV
jgi:glycosyltransferase involved in cell wall biosynthesis